MRVNKYFYKVKFMADLIALATEIYFALSRNIASVSKVALRVGIDSRLFACLDFQISESERDKNQTTASLFSKSRSKLRVTRLELERSEFSS